MKQIRIVFALLVLLAVCLSVPSWAATVSGRVVDAYGNAFRQATVGIKTSHHATADALAYTSTDSDGNFTFSNLTQTTYYVAAWGGGWCASEDFTANCTSGDVNVGDVQLALAGDNYARQDKVSASCNSDIACLGANGYIDSYLDNGWNTRKVDEPEIGVPGTQYFYVDLEESRHISDVVLYMYTEQTEGAHFPFDNYQIDVMTNASANPLLAESWGNITGNGIINNVYSCNQSDHGYMYAHNSSEYLYDENGDVILDENGNPVINPEWFKGTGVNPIRLDLDGVRGLRIRYSGGVNELHSLLEVQVHGEEILPVNVTGRVLDTDGYPISGAVVGFKAWGMAHAAADAHQYATTNAGGFYTFYNVTPVHACVAAWYDGKVTSDDTPVAIDGSVANIRLEQAVTNFANSMPVLGSPDPNAMASYAVNGAIESAEDASWMCIQSPAYFYVDLGYPRDVDDIVLFMYASKNGDGFPRDDYSVDVLTENINPLIPSNWTTCTPVHSAWNSGHGYLYINGAEPNSGACVNAIGGLDLTGVRGIRISYDRGMWDRHNLMEIQVHGPASPLCVITGTVRDGFYDPVEGAIVGLKAGSQATADACDYVTTDSSGRYVITTDKVGEYQIAAWAPGKATGYDSYCTLAPYTVVPVDLFIRHEGINYALNKPVSASVNSGLAHRAVNGEIESQYPTDGWHSLTNGNTGPAGEQYFCVDLGQTYTLNNIVLYAYCQQGSNPNPLDDYQIDCVMNDDPSVDYTQPAAWDSSSCPVYTMYSFQQSNHGYMFIPNSEDPTKGIAVNPIMFEGYGYYGSSQARALRIRYNGGVGNGHFLSEIQVHGQPIPEPCVQGFIVDGTGKPVQGAIVGLKKTHQATADAIQYVTSGFGGFYGFYTLKPGTYYVSAWKQGLTTCEDIECTVDFGTPSNFPIRLERAGENLALNAQVSATHSTELGSAAGAVNGSIEGHFDYGWNSGWNVLDNTQFVCYYIDLGEAKEVSDVVIFRYYEDENHGNTKDDLTIDVMRAGDPINDPWDDNGNVDYGIYQGVQNKHGYGPYDAGNGTFDFTEVIPISINRTGVRGLRLTFDNYTWPKFFQMWEIEVHGKPVMPVTVTGTVVDSQNNPVSDAIIGLKYDQSYSEMATADANVYVKTNGSGNFTSIGYYAGKDLHVAAWKDGYTPSESVTYAGSPITLTLAVAQHQAALTADNVHATVYGKYATENKIKRVVDGTTPWILRDPTNPERREYVWNGWGDVWHSDYNDTGTHSVFVDLVIPTNLSDIILYMYKAEDANCNDYQIDVMTSTSADPLDEWNWTQEGNGVSTVYSAIQTDHGYMIRRMWDVDPDGVGVDPIRLSAQKVTGLRITYSNAANFHTLYQIVVHGTPEFVPIDHIGEAKTWGDTTKVVVSGKEVTAEPGYGGVPAGVAYIEDDDRASGIRIDTTHLESFAELGDLVEITGRMDTVDGERVIVAESVNATFMDRKYDASMRLAPLGMNNRFAGMKLAQGLYVKAWGAATDVLSFDGTRISFNLDDGSGTPIKVYAYAWSGIAIPNNMLTVKGVTSVENGSLVIYMTDQLAD